MKRLDITLQSYDGDGEGSEGGAGLMKGGMGRPRMEVEMGVVPKVASLKISVDHFKTR